MQSFKNVENTELESSDDQMIIIRKEQDANLEAGLLTQESTNVEPYTLAFERYKFDP